MGVDRFGNRFAPNLSYARGDSLPTTADDFKKLQHAWEFIRERGPEKIFVFTGLEHSLPMQADDLCFADDEIGPALHFDRLKQLNLEWSKTSAPAKKTAWFRFDPTGSQPTL